MPEQPKSSEHYADQLAALLPEGPFWQGFREHAGRGRAVLRGQAIELARVDGRAFDLIKESNPRGAREMLAARETEAGLPDSCSALADTEQERRRHLVRKWASTGGQSPQHYTAVAASLGYEVTFTEHRPFRCGLSQCGHTHQLGTDLQWHHWRVAVPAPRITYFRCGQSRVGLDPLGFVRRAEDLECVLQKTKPSHTVLHFQYEGI